jgi:hypothetical protein
VGRGKVRGSGKGAMRRRPGASKQRACLSKTGRYDTEDAAQRAADGYNRHHPYDIPRIAYQCQYAKGRPHWHIGQEKVPGR